MEILNIENLSFTYPQCREKALKNMSFSVNKGDFIAVCGATGSGKSTLLRMLKRELTPLGETEGSIKYCGTPLNELDAKVSACEIGFVLQRPEQQLVTDRVWHELAFGLENMGLEKSVIRRRVAEMSSYFGIEDWFDKDVAALSGGQKQLLNLASVMVMQPTVLILDEPTAQLDPIAASGFISTLVKLNRELSLTVIIAEHRLEEVVPESNKLLVVDSGEVFAFGETGTIVKKLREHPKLMSGMPAASRVFNALGADGECPLTVKDGRNFIETNYKNDIKALRQPDYLRSELHALELKNVCFRYRRELPDVLYGLDLTVAENEILCVLGGNGSGKTTALSAAAGLNKIYAGEIKVFGKKLKDYKNQTLYQNCLALLPQDVQTVFLKNTVREELAEIGKTELPYDLTPLYDKHPYDLSGGEQQLVALAKVLAQKPRLLLLDEPTKGLDASAKATFIDVLKTLKKSGVTIIIVTHDVEFAALCADRCALFFRGEIVSQGTPSEFFTENNYYTTAANRMTRGYYSGTVTVDDVISLCRENGKKEGVK